MPAAIEFTAPRVINVIDIPDAPAPPPGQATIRTHRMGVCGTDISCFLGKFPFFDYPRTPGHELGVEVVAIGDGVTHVQPGDRCSLEPYLNDPASHISQKGATNCCPALQVLGVHCDGGLRKGTYNVPAHKLHPGNDLSYDQLALVETLGIGSHAVQRANPQSGETVVVIGAGPIGLACLEFLKLMEGVTVIVIDLVQSRLDFCRDTLRIPHTVLASADPLDAIEAITGGRLADVVIDATGSPKSMSGCLEFAGFTGRVVYVGVTTSEISFPHAPILHRRELTLMASRNALPQDFTKIIGLMRSGHIHTAPWITHRLNIDEVPGGFEKLTDPELGAIKAIIEVD